MPRFFRYALVVLLIVGLHIFFYMSSVVKNMDHTFYDVVSAWFMPEMSEASHTVIVNIDEKSLEHYGQWPWPRVLEAKLIEKIHDLKPGAVGFDILFSESDRTSPVMFQQFYQEHFGIEVAMPSLRGVVMDNDQLFANALKPTGGVLSVYLYHHTEVTPNCSGLSYRENLFEPMPHASMFSILCNVQNVQASVDDFGFMNMQSDSDGRVRSLPMFLGYGEEVYPAFALAMLLSLDQEAHVIDERSFSVLNRTVRLNAKGEVLLNFKTSKATTVSALDILHDRVAPEIMQGKIVLIGLKAAGLSSSYLIPSHAPLSGVELQSIAIDNVLNELLWVKPLIYQEINLLLSLIMALVFLFFFFKRWYKAIFLGTVGTVVGSGIALTLGAWHQIYISIGYFWVPFAHCLLGMTIFSIFLSAQTQKKLAQQLQASHSATIESLALVVAMRDDETGAHLKRTKYYVKALAEYLYQQKKYADVLTPEQIFYISEAAPLHDIGKVGIPDSILKKPGRFTSEEYEVMKQHPRLAKEVIEKAKAYYDQNVFLDVAYNIAYCHHERWNGSGYPTGLKGDQIPLEAQLMAIADVYDALISRRCYKEGFSFEKSEQIIIDGSGKEFNPEIIEAFIALRFQFREIADRYRDEWCAL